MSEESAIREAMYGMQYNLPSGASTFGECAEEGCTIMARGSGTCLSCWEKKLGVMTRANIAKDYREALVMVRTIESTLIDEFT